MVQNVWTCALSLFTQQKTKSIVIIISLVFIIEYFELEAIIPINQFYWHNQPERETWFFLNTPR